MNTRALIIAAPASGSGKTTVTLALLGALARRGVAVRAAKVGPDYIDPAFHVAATGACSFNLDSWAMPPRMLDAIAAQAAREAEVLVIEGVMGLFDGVSGLPGRSGATADLAAHLRVPVLLVLDVSGQAQTAAAVVRGMLHHDPAVGICGVVLNRIGGMRHRTLVADAIAALNVRVMGAVPRDQTLALPERHLGLVQAAEHADLAARIDCLAAMAEQHIDLDAVIAAAAPLNAVATAAVPALAPPGQRIALAQDAAFTFVYPHILDGWRKRGAEIVPFSPLADEPPPTSCDCCWLPGGYPELHAAALAAAGRFRAGLAQFAKTGKVHGECGGYMVLGEGLEDAEGVSHAMTGLLGHATSFAKPKLHLGYREARLLVDGVLGEAGTTVRGHEFHYATLTAAGRDEAFAELADAEGRTLGRSGGRRGQVTGTFFHAIAPA